ncbi:unnamed protein product [Macrosiphum euphorbiae]|uniref:Uncharacterized protein n=1 Tax=Macrosiphum euphorbiae TaxID=13131 RepID=A0AAV0W498_9HEMI|nr:unnamed protein product [Macrosiphum euphorbiae]
MADDEAYTADEPTLTMGPKIVCITELCNQQPLPTTSTSSEDLQVEAVQRSLNLPPLSLFQNDKQSVGSLQECEFHTHSECNYSSKDNACRYMAHDER